MRSHGTVGFGVDAMNIVVLGLPGHTAITDSGPDVTANRASMTAPASRPRTFKEQLARPASRIRLSDG